MNSRPVCKDHGDDADVPLYVDTWAADSSCIAMFLTISGDEGRVSTPAAGSMMLTLVSSVLSLARA